jgi:hypothetical protein
VPEPVLFTRSSSPSSSRPFSAPSDLVGPSGVDEKAGVLSRVWCRTRRRGSSLGEEDGEERVTWRAVFSLHVAGVGGGARGAGAKAGKMAERAIELPCQPVEVSRAVLLLTNEIHDST